MPRDAAWPLDTCGRARDSTASRPERSITATPDHPFVSGVMREAL